MADETALTDEELEAQIQIAQQRRAKGFQEEYQALTSKWRLQIQGFPEYTQDGRTVIVHRVVEVQNNG